MTKRFRSLTVWLMILTLTLGSSALGATAQQGYASDPLFEADGVDATILAQADIGDLESGATLLLELIELAPETELPTHRTTSPELLYTLGGAVTFQDNFGFASVVDASQVVSLNAGTEYTVASTESEAGRLLRLRLADGAAATPGATPAAEDDGATTVLMQAPLEGVEMEGAHVYLARAQFGANADSGEQAHAGPLGIYVDAGTLNVVSPSGLVGSIETGRAVSLPAATPLRASTGETEAVAFIVGVAGSDGEPFTRIASSNGFSVAGDVLDGGDAWRSETAEMTVDYKQYNSIIRFTMTYSNLGDSSVDLNLDKNALSLIDDGGRDWLYIRSDCSAVPDEAVATCDVDFKPPVGTPRGPMMLTFHIGQFGDIKDAAWQMKIDW